MYRVRLGKYREDNIPHFSICSISVLLYCSGSRVSCLLELRIVGEAGEVPGSRGWDQDPIR